MGSGHSIRWDKAEKRHRLLSLAFSGSTYMDPRHLEHFSYPLWNTQAAHLIVKSGYEDLMVGPQFPMWTSAREQPLLGGDPDVSTATAPDGSARGVAVDLAIFLPVVRSRRLKFFRTHKASLKKLSLMGFINGWITKDPNIAVVSPRALWTDELWAPILMELKVPPPRHPTTLTTYILSVDGLMTNAQEQSDEQGLCLFCVWRFASQWMVFLLAISGDVWSVRRLTRAQAAKEFEEHPNTVFSPDRLIMLKDQEEETAATDEDLPLMYSNPLLAFPNKIALQNQARDERAQAREARKAAPPPPAPVPNDDDRGLPLFSDDEINACSRVTLGHDFFESVDPKVFFGGAAEKNEATGWSKALRLGTPMSDKYKEFLSGYLRDAAPAEMKRREKEFFDRES